MLDRYRAYVTGLERRGAAPVIVGAPRAGLREAERRADAAWSTVLAARDGGGGGRDP